MKRSSEEPLDGEVIEDWDVQNLVSPDRIYFTNTASSEKNWQIADSLKLFWKQLASALMELFFPVECVGCGIRETVICPDCLSAFLLPPVEVSGINPQLKDDMPVWAQGEYRGAYRQGILAFKHEKERDWDWLFKYIGASWAKVLTAQQEIGGKNHQEIWLVSAPASKQSKWSVPDQIAWALGQALRAQGVKARCLPLLSFRQGAKTQQGKSYWERLKAREKTMYIPRKNREGLRKYVKETANLWVILIDDVVTSGGTVMEMRRVFEELGVRNFALMCFCLA